MSNQELIDKFIADGGIVETLEYIPPKSSKTVNKATKLVPELKSLEEAELLYGKKQEREKSKKKQNLSKVDMNYIPDHIKKLLNIGL